MARLVFSVGLFVAWSLRVVAEANYHLNVTEPVGTNLINNTDFSVSCISCYAIGDLSLSGGNSDSPPDSNFSSLPFDFTQEWAGAVVEDFKVHVELSFQLTPQNLTNEITIPLLGQNGFTVDTPIIGPILGIDWNFDPILHGWVNASKPVNFTYGLELVVPNSSAVYIPIPNVGNTQTIGFNNTKLTPLNYTSSDPSDDFAFEISFRPILRASISALTFETPLEATVFVDVPKLDVNVGQVSNVTNDCKPAPAGTPSDRVYSNLTFVDPVLSYDFGFNVTGVSTHVYQIGDNDTLPTSCLEYQPDKKQLSPPKVSKSVPTTTPEADPTTTPGADPKTNSKTNVATKLGGPSGTPFFVFVGVMVQLLL